MSNLYGLPQAEISEKNSIKTCIGKVAVVNTNYKIPMGWRIMQIGQAKQIKDQLNQLLGKWSVIAFRTGKLTGVGFGNTFEEGFNQDTNQVFIIDYHAD